MAETFHCRSSLAEIKHAGYSSGALKQLTGGHLKMPYQVDFKRADVIEARTQQVRQLSISGVQDKISIILKRGKLEITDKGGMFILKPIPSNLHVQFQDQLPANEHLTMQLASQVYKIKCAANALISMADGELAYITRRFDAIDLRASPEDKNNRRDMEDFCSLSQRSPETHGKNYKYDGSYEEIGAVLKQYCPAYITEIEKLFRVIVFNYLISNGDAHQKNFSLLASNDGDHLLCPAYDLVCTSMHLPNESRCALDVFADDYETEFYKTNGFYGRSDFEELANRYRLLPRRRDAILNEMLSETSYKRALTLIKRSFLSDEAKGAYASLLQDRLRALGFS